MQKPRIFFSFFFFCFLFSPKNSLSLAGTEQSNIIMQKRRGRRRSWMEEQKIYYDSDVRKVRCPLSQEVPPPRPPPFSRSTTSVPSPPSALRCTKEEEGEWRRRGSCTSSHAALVMKGSGLQLERIFFCEGMKKSSVSCTYNCGCRRRALNFWKGKKWNLSSFYPPPSPLPSSHVRAINSGAAPKREREWGRSKATSFLSSSSSSFLPSSSSFIHFLVGDGGQKSLLSFNPSECGGIGGKVGWRNSDKKP